MKTPLDNFEFTHDVHNIEVKIEATHSTLPIIFMRKYNWTTKFSPDTSQVIVNVTTALCRDIILSSIYGIAQTFCDEQTLGIFPVPNGKPGFIYSPEWDKEKEAWFILDENNNKIYE